MRLHEWSLFVQLHIAYDKFNIHFIYLFIYFSISLFEKRMYMIKVLKTCYYIKLIACYCHRQNMHVTHLFKSKSNNKNYMNDYLRENNVMTKMILLSLLNYKIPRYVCNNFWWESCPLEVYAWYIPPISQILIWGL